MRFCNISTALEIVNGLPHPNICKIPQGVINNKPLTFNNFIERLEKHFQNKNSAPVMISDGKFSRNIIGIQRDGSNTILWIADPNIQNGANQQIDNQKSPSGLYRVTFDDKGNQIRCSLENEDHHQRMNYTGESYRALRFDVKHWLVLFPLEPLAS
jgi:hypothetical protein